MSIYDINFYDQGNNLLPPNKRRPGILAFMKSLTWPLQWLHGNFFTDYAAGFTGPKWTIGANWLAGQQARDSDHSVYEALIAIAPHGLPPHLNSSWIKVSDIWIGVNERVKYNGIKLVLTFALNRWFDTVFRQPNGSPEDPIGNPAGTSDIYISNNSGQLNIFAVGAAAGNTNATISREDYTATYDIPASYTFTGVQCFTINVPLAVFNALAATNPDSENIIRNFADQYVLAGMNYKVSTY